MGRTLKRFWYWLLPLFPLCLALLLGVAFLTHRSAQITEETFRAIRHGMSRAEVEAILGGPPGDYTTGQRDDYYVLSCEGTTCSFFHNLRYSWKPVGPESLTPVTEGGTIDVWWGRGYAIGIEFTGAGHVCAKGLGVAYRPPSLFDQARSWLGL